MFINSQDLIKKMDKAGQAGRPFLFAFNFEMTEGLFIPDPLQKPNCPSGVLFDINGVTNSVTIPRPPGTFHFEPHPEAFASYQSRFSCAMAALQKKTLPFSISPLKPR